MSIIEECKIIEFVVDSSQEDCVLKLNLPYFALQLRPENPGGLKVEDEQWSSCPGNGTFSMNWSLTTHEVSFCVAKYGDGNGGSIDVTLKLTPGQWQAFINELKRWENHNPKK